MTLDMSLSNNGFLELAFYEGLCLRPYYDSEGVLTIGFGETITDIPNLASWDKSKYITVQNAIASYLSSLQKYIDTVNKSLDVLVWQYQFDALVSICYNIGQYGFSNSTFIKMINSNSSLLNIKDAILLWDKPPEIIKRRKNEVNLFINGNYSNNGFVELLDTDGKGHQLQSSAKNIDLRPFFVT